MKSIDDIVTRAKMETNSPQCAGCCPSWLFAWAGFLDDEDSSSDPAGDFKFTEMGKLQGDVTCSCDAKKSEKHRDKSQGLCCCGTRSGLMQEDLLRSDRGV